jgi:hypothetical protein
MTWQALRMLLFDAPLFQVNPREVVLQIYSTPLIDKGIRFFT